MSTIYVTTQTNVAGTYNVIATGNRGTSDLSGFRVKAANRRDSRSRAAAARPAHRRSQSQSSGALAYLAAYDVHRAQLFGRTEPTTGIEPFGRLVERVMTVEPYASAKRVFWVVDNGSSHRGQASVDGLEGRWPKRRLIHLPVHAAWLNHGVVIVFAIVQRKVVTPNDFDSLEEIAERLAAFEDRYYSGAQPFDWTFTRGDLNDLLARIGAHEPAAPAPLSMAA